MDYILKFGSQNSANQNSENQNSGGGIPTLEFRIPNFWTVKNSKAARMKGILELSARWRRLLYELHPNFHIPSNRVISAIFKGFLLITLLQMDRKSWNLKSRKIYLSLRQWWWWNDILLILWQMKRNQSVAGISPPSGVIPANLKIFSYYWQNGWKKNSMFSWDTSNSWKSFSIISGDTFAQLYLIFFANRKDNLLWRFKNSQIQSLPNKLSYNCETAFGIESK